jgi:hypothetical protein
MVRSQNMAKFFYGWSWRILKKWKNEKIKKINDVIIIITIYNSFIYFLNEKF